jgi:hypothetical protein
MTTRAMSPLQQRMLEDMQLRGLSARTQEAYARAVWQLAQHYHRRPDQLGEEELRQSLRLSAARKALCRLLRQPAADSGPPGPSQSAHHGPLHASDPGSAGLIH